MNLGSTLAVVPPSLSGESDNQPGTQRNRPERGREEGREGERERERE